jgi:uncharacterized protein
MQPSPERTLFTSWLRRIVYHPVYVFFFITLITLLFAVRIPSLKLATRIYDLTIQDLPETQIYNQFRKVFGCEEIIMVVARTDGAFKPTTFSKIEELAVELSKIGGIKQVISLPGIKKSMDITGKWNLADFEQVVGFVSLFQKNLISSDKQTTAITLVLEDVEDKGKVTESVQKLIDAYQEGLSLYQVGMPTVSSALAQFTEQDFITLPIVTFLLIALILLLFYRNLRGVLIPIGTVLIALIWTFGLLAWTGTPLSILIMIVPVFLIAVGTAYCMYIFPQYYASLKQSAIPREAAVTCFSRLGFPTVLVVLTTIIGLGSLLVNRMVGVREFAVFSCIGIFFLLILLLTFLPAVMGLLPATPSSLSEAATNRVGDQILSGIIRLNLLHQKITLPLIAIIAIIGVIGLTRIQVETNPIEFFKKDSPVARNFRDIYKDMSGTFPLSVVIHGHEEGYFENPANLQKIEQIQEFLNSLPGVDKTISFVDYLKLINFASNQYNPEFYALPTALFEIRNLVNNFKTLLGQDMLVRFVSPEFSTTHIMLRTHISSSAEFLSIEARIRDHLRNYLKGGESFQVTGFGIVISHSSRLISEGQIKSLGLTLVIVFVIMVLLFMSYKVGIVALVSNCFPIIVSFGMMGWFRIPLSMATSLIASVAIGLTVDDIIHYLVNYNRVFRIDLDKTTSLDKTIHLVGKPIIATTLTISIGFSVLMFSSFKPTAVFGLLMMITMISALVADLILLPSLMLHTELVTLWDLLKFKFGKNPQKNIPLFNGMSRHQIQHVLMAGSMNTYKKGSVIFKKGECSDVMYVIVSGELQIMDSPYSISRYNSSVPSQVIATLKTGDTVGEMGLIRSCERSATVVASQPTELLQINGRMIKRLQLLYWRTAHRFFLNLMKELSNRLENATHSFLSQTVTDSVTGFHNRDFFINVLNGELSLSKSVIDKEPLSLLLVSLEDLPSIAIREGHDTAEGVLKMAGKVLEANMEEKDHLCRFDYNQFACILPETSPKAGLRLCEEIRAQIESHAYPNGNGGIHIQVNTCVVSTNHDGKDTVDSLIDAAYRSLAQNRGS